MFPNRHFCADFSTSHPSRVELFSADIRRILFANLTVSLSGQWLVGWPPFRCGNTNESAACNEQPCPVNCQMGCVASLLIPYSIQCHVFLSMSLPHGPFRFLGGGRGDVHRFVRP